MICVRCDKEVAHPDCSHCNGYLCNLCCATVKRELDEMIVETDNAKPLTEAEQDKITDRVSKKRRRQ